MCLGNCGSFSDQLQDDMGTAIVLIGGGGHCESCIEALESTGIWEITGIVDPSLGKGDSLLGYPILGGDEQLPFLAVRCSNALITVGHIISAASRRRLFTLYFSKGFSLPVITASTARVSMHARFGAGTIVLHGAFINAGAFVGENCIINTGAIIEHNASIGPHCHVSTGALINGDCSIGSECFVGSGAVLRNGVRMVSGVVLGAGSVVIHDILEAGVYVGNPARKIK